VSGEDRNKIKRRKHNKKLNHIKILKRTNKKKNTNIKR
jgi:hypothetical protein